MLEVEVHHRRKSYRRCCSYQIAVTRYLYNNSNILDLIEDYCIEKNLIDEVEEKPTAETAKVLKLKLELECEERRLSREEAQRAHDTEKALQDGQLLQARELRLAELKEARELRELELKQNKKRHF